jgi:hypothetical protein
MRSQTQSSAAIAILSAPIGINAVFDYGRGSVEF